MSHARLTYIFMLALVLLAGRAHAQQPQSAKDDKQTADAAMRSKAIDLLETVADQVSTLQSAENRARLGSNLAASLWKHNEPRARNLLVSVQNDLNTGLQKVDEDERTNTQTHIVFLKLRMDTVERIAKHDAETALAFLKATEPDYALIKSDEIAEMNRRLEMQLANQIAAENPDLALKLGRKSLARGFSDDLLSLLRLLQRKDKDKALSLYKEAVAKLVSTGLKQYSPAFYFAQSLARSYKPPLIDEEAYRELINLFIDTAFKHGCHKTVEEGNPSYFCHELGSLLPQMEKVDEVRAAELKEWAPEPSESHYDPGAYAEIEDVARNGTVDEMLALADKHPHLQYQIHWRAILMAEESGDIERARKIATTHINDPYQRNEVLDRLDRAQSWLSMSAGNLAEAHAAISKIPTVYGRAIFLMHLANQIGAKDRKSALKLLGQASEMIDTMKPGREQTEAEMGLAMMYCLEKDQRCFDRIQPLLPKLNELVAAAVKLDGYDSHNVRDGEWNMSSQGSVGALLTALSQNANYFAWCDFDRAVSMAGQFERPEIRLMAQLKLAHAILAGPPKRFTFTPYISFH